jgi:cell division protein ZipA
MSELRWALLIVGVVFFAGLTVWELRRPRQAREPEVPPESTRAREPALQLPEIHARESLSGGGLPVVELLEDLESLPVLEPPPVTGEPEATEYEFEAPEIEAGEAAAAAPAPAPLDVLPGLQGLPELREVPELPEVPGLGELPELPELAAAPAPRVEWPPDEERRIVAVRLVAPLPERFAGRSVRQALAAEGFVLGRFAIFHKADETQRAILSAASLTRPGTFDPQTMDSQHFGGLSLFAVLPGPLPPPQVFEELVTTARNLNERLCGVLQDEGGTPLTPARIASLREHLASEALS